MIVNDKFGKIWTTVVADCFNQWPGELRKSWEPQDNRPSGLETSPALREYDSR